jgi:hypothetical protein
LHKAFYISIIPTTSADSKLVNKVAVFKHQLTLMVFLLLNDDIIDFLRS